MSGQCTSIVYVEKFGVECTEMFYYNQIISTQEIENIEPYFIWGMKLLLVNDWALFQKRLLNLIS